MNKTAIRFVFMVFVTILFLTFCVQGYAEAVSLDSLNNDDLLNLYHEIYEELFDRGVFVDEEIARGNYLVGEDIKEGCYCIYCNKVDGYVDYRVYKDETSDGISNIEISGRAEYGEIEKFYITNGQVLKIYDEDTFIKIDPDKPSFAP